MTVNNYINELLKENEENPQIVAIYDEKHNLHYLGKVAYAPMNCWFPFKNAHMVGNELRINDIAEETESTEEIIDGSESNEEITVQEAIAMPHLIIDMVTRVNGCDFHRGMRCKINGYPFELMAENGELSLEAEMIALTAHKQKVVEVPKFNGGQTIAIVELYYGYAKAYLITLPKKVRQESIIIK